MRRHEPLPRDEGSVGLFVAVLTFGLVMVAGLAIDGGRILGSLAEARDIADNAARAAAQEIDLDELRSTGQPRLDSDAATARANTYLASTGHTGSVTVTDDAVVVTVQVRSQPSILPIGTRTVRATEEATAVPGIEGGGS